MTQWKEDIAVYETFTLPVCRMICTAIDIEWAASKQLGQRGRRPPYPPHHKRPLKLRDGRDPGYPGVGELPMVPESAHGEDCAGGSNDESEVESEAEELINSMNSLAIGPRLVHLHSIILQSPTSILRG